MMKWISCLVFVFVFVFVLMANGAGATEALGGQGLQKRVLITAMEFPGYSEKDGGGLGVELVERAFRAAGVNVEFEVLPINRAIAKVMSGKSDIVLGNNWYLPEDVRQGQHVVPLFPVNNVVFYDQSKFDPADRSLKEVLDTYVMATAFAPDGAYTANSRYRVTHNPADVVSLVEQGRETIGLLPWVSVARLVAMNSPDSIANMRYFSTPILREWSGLVFNKKAQDYQYLLERLEYGLVVISNNGERNRVMRRYWPDQQELSDLLGQQPLFGEY